MKVLKWVLAAMAVFGIALLVGGLLLPSTTEIRRSIVIERPASEVFATLDSFQRYRQWSPWLQADPHAVITMDGPAAGMGAILRWTGNAAVGSGSLEILQSEPNAKVVTAMDFGSSRSTTVFELLEQDGGTLVSWRMASEHGLNPLDRWFGAVLLDKMVGPDFERGLSRLKQLLEQPRTP